MTTDNAIAHQLADMATRDGFVYKPTGVTEKVNGRVWHQMLAYTTDDRSPVAKHHHWNYWLSRKDGSYEGRHHLP